MMNWFLISCVAIAFAVAIWIVVDYIRIGMSANKSDEQKKLADMLKENKGDKNGGK